MSKEINVDIFKKELKKIQEKLKEVYNLRLSLGLEKFQVKDDFDLEFDNHEIYGKIDIYVNHQYHGCYISIPYADLNNPIEYFKDKYIEESARKKRLQEERLLQEQKRKEDMDRIVYEKLKKKFND